MSHHLDSAGTKYVGEAEAEVLEAGRTFVFKVNSLDDQNKNTHPEPGCVFRCNGEVWLAVQLMYQDGNTKVIVAAAKLPLGQ